MIRRIIPIIAALAVIVSAARLDADVVYFVSKSDGGLYTFNTAGGGVSSLNGAGPGTFSSPSALAMGPDGNLYVGDATGGGSIRRYSMSGGSVATVATLSGSNPSFGSGPVSPASIAFASSGAMLVGRNPESGFSGGPSGPVLQLSGWEVGGSPAIQDFTSNTSLDYSPGLAVAPDGTLYVSNSIYNFVPPPGQSYLTGNVLKFNAAGVYQSVMAADNSFTGGLFGPTGLVVSGNSLFIASTMNGNIYRTDLANPDTATNTTQFASAGSDYPGPLALLSNGGLLAASVASPTGLIYQFGPSGNLVNTFNESGSYGQIGGIVAVPEPGAMFLAAAGGVVLVLRRFRGGRRKA